MPLEKHTPELLAPALEKLDRSFAGLPEFFPAPDYLYISKKDAPDRDEKYLDSAVVKDLREDQRFVKVYEDAAAIVFSIPAESHG